MKKAAVCTLLILFTFGYSQDCPAGQRLFDHDLLMTDALCIPENPQRIIGLDMASVEASLLAGKEVLALSSWVKNELPLLVPAFADSLQDAENVGYPANLELVLSLQPDVILVAGASEAGESIDIESAQEIAPVVVADPIIYTDWMLGMQFWSEVLGVSQVYDAMLENYEARVRELQAAIGTPSDIAVSVAATSSYGIMLWMPDTSPGKVLSDVGFSRPEPQSLVGEAAQARYESDKYINISEEKLDLLEGDVLFHFTYAATDPDTAEKENQAIKDLTANPLWQALGVVRAGDAHFVPGYWWRPQTYYLANQLLDDLYSYVAETEPSTVVLGIDELSALAQ